MGVKKKQHRTERITLMLTEDEFLSLKSQAQQRGFSNFSEFIRVMVFNGLKGFTLDRGD